MSTLTIKQGKTWEQVLSWLDENGDPVDLTGATFAFQARTDWADTEEDAGTDPVVDLATGSGVTVDGDDIVMSLTAAETEVIAAGVYLCEMEVTWADDTVEQVFSGRLTVEPEVVR